MNLSQEAQEAILKVVGIDYYSGTNETIECAQYMMLIFPDLDSMRAAAYHLGELRYGNSKVYVSISKLDSVKNTCKLKIHGAGTQIKLEIENVHCNPDSLWKAKNEDAYLEECLCVASYENSQVIWATREQFEPMKISLLF